MTDASGAPIMTSGFWFEEEVTEEFATKMMMKGISFDQQSDFQRVQVIETATFGKTLVLDGKTQSALRDEHVYHESLVHPAMLAHPSPKNVYIGGGGEYATAREVLRHSSVEKCVMVDIDKVCCDICEEQLPEWSDGCTRDPRLEVHFEDAKAFLEKDDRTYDVIIMDIADPIEAGPGIVLYTQEFYRFAVTKLSPNGILVTQSGPGAIFNWEECFSTIHQTLRTAFTTVVPYASNIPSFGSSWAFNLAYNKAAGEAPGDEGKAEGAADCDGLSRSMLKRSCTEIDAAISARIDGNLKFYDGIAHMGIFGLPKEVRRGLDAEKRVMTIDNPVFMH